MDQAVVSAATQRFFDAELCVAVEVEHGVWEPRTLVLRSASMDEALAGVERTLDLAPDRRVRLVGYSPSHLTPAASPAPVLCSPNGDRPLAA